MPTFPIANHSSRCALLAALALLLAILLAPSGALAAPSTAVDAAQARGTPVIKPPVKRKPKPLTCKVTRRVRTCVAKATTCTTTSGTRKCVNGTARCRLVGRVKRCTITKITCTSSKTRKNRCRRTSVKKTATQAFAVLASQAIPRFLSRGGPSAGAREAAAVVKLVSSRPGTPAAEPMVPVATSQQPSASGVGAGIAALVLAFVLMSIMLVRRRPRRD